MRTRSAHHSQHRLIMLVQLGAIAATFARLSICARQSRGPIAAITRRKAATPQLDTTMPLTRPSLAAHPAIVTDASRSDVTFQTIRPTLPQPTPSQIDACALDAARSVREPGTTSRLKPPKYVLLAATYLVAITMAEIVTSIVNPLWGVMLHVVLLTSLLVQAGRTDDDIKRALTLTIATGPIIRIISLGMPLTHFAHAWRYAVTSLPLLVMAAALVRTIPLTREEAGLQFPTLRDWPLTILVAVSGIGLGYLEYLILRPAAIANDLAVTTILVPALILLIGTGFVEELLFRGIMQTVMTRAVGVGFSVAYSSTMFSVLHIGHLSVIDVFFVLAVAVYFAIVFARTRTLLGIAIAHGLTNIMLFIVFPLMI